MDEPYVRGYFAKSKVNVVNDGAGILPRLEINAVNFENSVLFLQAMQMYFGTGRVTGTPAAALMLIEDPGALRTVIEKYVADDPFGKRPAALKALKILKRAAANAGAAASSNSTPGRGGSSGGSSSSSTQHAPSAEASTADDTPRSSDDGGVDTNATLAAGSPAAADPQNRDQREHKRVCASCGAKGEKRCSVCRTTWYCGRDCQKADWAGHKQSCKPSA